MHPQNPPQVDGAASESCRYGASCESMQEDGASAHYIPSNVLKGMDPCFNDCDPR